MRKRERWLSFEVFKKGKANSSNGRGAIVVQGVLGEHQEKQGFLGGRGESIRKSPVRIRAETVSRRQSREQTGRSPWHTDHFSLIQSYQP